LGLRSIPEATLFASGIFLSCAEQVNLKGTGVLVCGQELFSFRQLGDIRPFLFDFYVGIMRGKQVQTIYLLSVFMSFFVFKNMALDYTKRENIVHLQHLPPTFGLLLKELFP
jgi:hypothetical protein